MSDNEPMPTPAAAEAKPATAAAEVKPAPAKKPAAVEAVAVDNHASRAVLAAFAGKVTAVPSICRETILSVTNLADLLDVLRFLRDDAACKCDLLLDETSVHWPEDPQPFELVYQLYSVANNAFTRVKARTTGEAPSVVGIWPTANWLEREIYDMMGITFTGHPDLTRILLPDDWNGFPQRKDYPLGGIGQEEDIRGNVWERPGLRKD